MKKWFKNRIKKVMEYNEKYGNAMTVKECEKLDMWTPVDLILREYYNNGGGSAKGFLGISRSECIKCYDYIKENQKELIAADLISKDGYNNWGIPLWTNYNIH